MVRTKPVGKANVYATVGTIRDDRVGDGDLIVGIGKNAILLRIGNRRISDRDRIAAIPALANHGTDYGNPGGRAVMSHVHYHRIGYGDSIIIPDPDAADTSALYSYIRDVNLITAILAPDLDPVGIRIGDCDVADRDGGIIIPDVDAGITAPNSVDNDIHDSDIIIVTDKLDGIIADVGDVIVEDPNVGIVIAEMDAIGWFVILDARVVNPVLIDGDIPFAIAHVDAVSAKTVTINVKTGDMRAVAGECDDIAVVGRVSERLRARRGEVGDRA